MALLQTDDLDRVLTIRRRRLIDDGMAVGEGDDMIVVDRWASKRDVSDGEQLRAGQQGSKVTTRFQVLFDDFTCTIGGSDELTCEGARYAITGVKEIGTRARIEISAVGATDARR